MAELNNVINEEDYTPDLIDLEDEDGNTVTFEIIDGMEFEGSIYFALTPYSEDENEETEEDEFVILKETEKDGETFLATIDNDDEYEKIGTAFLERFSELFSEEE